MNNKIKLQAIMRLGGECRCCHNVNIAELIPTTIAITRQRFHSDTLYRRIIDTPDIAKEYVCLCNNNKCHFYLGYNCKNCNEKLTTLNWDMQQRTKNKLVCIDCGKRKRTPGTNETKFYGRVINLAIKLEMIEAYGGKCVGCGETHPFFLTLDHINNNGYLEKRRGIDLYTKLRQNGFPQSEFQLLCHTCNAIKEYTQVRNKIQRSSTPAVITGGVVFFNQEKQRKFKMQAEELLIKLDAKLSSGERSPFIQPQKMK